MAKQTYKFIIDWSDVEKANDALVQALAESKKIAEDAYGAVETFVSDAMKDISTVAGAVSSAMSTVQSAVKPVFDGLKTSLSATAAQAKVLGDVLAYDVTQPVIAAWKAMSSSIVGAMTGAFTSVDSLFKRFEDTVNKFFPTFVSLAQGAFSVFKSVAVAAFNAVGTVASATWGVITGGVSTMVGAVTSAVSMMLSPIKSTFNAITSQITKAFNAIVGPIKAAWKRVYDTFTDPVGSIIKAFKGLWGFIGGIFSKIRELLGSTYVAIGLVAGLHLGLRNLDDYEDAVLSVELALKRTAHVAGFTSSELDKMARALQDNTRYSRESAKSAQAAALEYLNVRGDVFARALELGADKASRDSQDLVSATKWVADALNDPLKAAEKLRQENIWFTESQRLMVEQMTLSGNVIGAQQVILDALSDAMGGRAAASAETFSGRVAQMQNAILSAWTAIAQGLTPALKLLADWFKEGAKRLEAWAPIVEKVTQLLVDMVLKSLEHMKKWYVTIKDYVANAMAFIVDAAIRAFSYIETAITNMPEFMAMAKAKFEYYWEAMAQSLMTTWNTITTVLPKLWENATILMQNAWGNGMVAMKREFGSMTGWLARQMTEIPGLAELFGVDKFDWQQTLDEMERAKVPDFKNKALVPIGMTEEEKRKAGPTDAEKQRLEELRKAAEAAAVPFNEKFAETLAKNREMFEQFKSQFKEFFTPKTEEENKGGGDKRRKGGRQFPFAIDFQSSAGKFEDLISTNKRIASAAAARSAEVRAIDNLTETIKMQAKKDEKQQEKQEVAMNTSNSELRDLNKFFKNNGIPALVAGEIA